MHRKSFIYIFLLSLFIVGCGKQIPKGVINPDKMENILYDYHLTDIMGDKLSYQENYKKEEYKEYVFRKYNITQADFDSSMVWYTRHSDELAKIYLNLSKKFRKNQENLNNMIANRGTGVKTVASGDSVDIWNSSLAYWLSSSPLVNKMTFQIVADTSFRQNDSFIFEADFIFLKGGKQNATMAMNITFENDSTAGRIRNITTSCHGVLALEVPSNHNIRSINGFIYYKGENRMPGLLVENIRLMRYHNNKPMIDEVTKPDSIISTTTMDTMKAAPVIDSISSTPEQSSRSNPLEMREKNARDRRPRKTN